MFAWIVFVVAITTQDATLTYWLGVPTDCHRWILSNTFWCNFSR